MMSVLVAVASRRTHPHPARPDRRHVERSDWIFAGEPGCLDDSVTRRTPRNLVAVLITGRLRWHAVMDFEPNGDLGVFRSTNQLNVARSRRSEGHRTISIDERSSRLA